MKRKLIISVAAILVLSICSLISFDVGYSQGQKEMWPSLEYAWGQVAELQSGKWE